MGEYFNEKVIGCIVLIDLDNVNWGYHRYLVKSLNHKIETKKIFICKQNSDYESFRSHDIRTHLGIDDETVLRFFSDVDPNNCRHILFTLLNEIDSKYQYLSDNESERVASE